MIHRPLEAARKRPKLGWLLALYTCGLIVAAIGATATVVGWQFWEEREARIGEFLDRRAVQLADELASGITDHLRVMRAHAARDDLVDRVTGRGARSAGARNPLDALQAAWPEFMWIGIADRTGRIVAATRDQQLGGDVSEREWFRAGLEGPYLAVPRGGVGERILELAYPMLDDRSEVVGVIAGELPRAWVDRLRKRIGAASAEAMRFDLAVAHADGVPLGGANAALIDLDAPAVERWRAVLGAPPGAQMPYLAGAPLGGEPEVSVLGWYAIASMPRSVLAEEIGRLRRQTIVAGMAVAALLLPLSLVIARVLSEPIAALKRSLIARRAGQAATIPLAGTVETVALGEAVRGLLDDLDSERAALLAHERRLEGIIATAPDAIVSADIDGRVLRFNAAAEAMFGVAAADMMGEPLDRLLPASLRERHMQHLRDFAAGTDAARAVGRTSNVVGVRGDGSTFPIEASVFRTTVDGETVFSAILRDVSQARATSAELRRSEERYRALFERHPVPMWVFDAQTLGFLAVNDVAVQKYGWSRAEFQGMTILDVRPPVDRERVLKEVSKLTPDRFNTGVWPHRLRSGQEILVEASGCGLVWEGRPACLAMLYDVTERENVLAESSRNREQLSELSRELMDKEAAERRRLSQLLHDRFAQNLAAAKLALESARLRGVPPEHLQPPIDLLEEALGEVRGLLHDLRPPLLDDFGLRAALQFEIDRRQNPDGPRLQLAPLALGAVEPRLDSAVEYGMFGIAREALANALFHARATAVDVTLELQAHDARLSVRDDGIGFSAADELRARHHLGLVSMRERAGWIGAQLVVQSQPGKGTVVKLHWHETAGSP